MSTPIRPASARLAGPADRPAVVALRDAALAEAEGLRGGVLYVTKEADPLPGPDDTDRRLFVAELAGGVVAYLTCSVDGRLGRVEAIYTDPACRGVGAGEAMMALAIDWCRARGCTGLDARALPGARLTKNFFEESGFTARLLVMHREL